MPVMYKSLLTTEQNRRQARWREVAGSFVITDYGESDTERERAFSNLSFIDLSPLPRAGIRGKDLSQWTNSKNYVVGTQSNYAYAQHDGVLIARLSPGELMLLANPADPSVIISANSIAATHQCYPVRRQDSHYWFALTGDCSPLMFAKLCGVDLSPDVFVNHSTAQTSVARTSAVIVRHDINEVLCYYLLGDSSTILYMWTCILDAVSEFNGQVLGLRAMHSLTGPTGE